MGDSLHTESRLNLTHRRAPLAKPAKTLLVFFAAVGISLLAAVHRFRDSGHAMGQLSAQGGKVRHAVYLEPGKRQYLVIVTGTVVPPYRGSARVTVEGWPEMDYEIHCQAPVVDLKLRRRPGFDGHVLENVEPKDRFALWVVMRPRIADWEAAAQEHRLQNTITLRDTKSGKTVLQVPVVYQPEEGSRHGRED
jgi:hypothetical protein